MKLFAYATIFYAATSSVDAFTSSNSNSLTRGQVSLNAARPKVNFNKKKAAAPKKAFKSAGKSSGKSAANGGKGGAAGFQKTIVVEDLPGVLPPVGFFDPLGLAAKANDQLIRKYREAELTHGRIAMLAFLGFFVGEAVGKFSLFPGVSGYGIGQIDEVPGSFWITFWCTAFAIETRRSRNAIVPSVAVPRSSPLFGTYRQDYLPGDLKFDPLGLKPEDPEELKIMQTKELQHGRVAMIAASGFLAQELTNQQGIIENVVTTVKSFTS